MWQTGLVVICLLAALLYAVRHFVRLYRSPQAMCTGCTGCCGPPPDSRPQDPPASRAGEGSPDSPAGGCP